MTSLLEFAKTLDEKTGEKICLIGSRAAAHIMDNKFRKLEDINDYDFIMSQKSCKDFLLKNAGRITKFQLEVYKTPKPLPKKTTSPTTSPSGATTTVGPAVSTVSKSPEKSPAGSEAPLTTGSPGSSEDINIHNYKMSMVIESKMIEIEVPVAVNSSANMFLELCSNKYLKQILFLGIDAFIPQIILLERLKWSHIYWPVNFQKHIKDMHCIRDFMGTYPSVDEKEIDTTKFVEMRRKEHVSMYGDPSEHINLNKTNEDFLEKDLLNVHKMIPHDNIHELVMFGSVPKYKLIKHDQSKAMCDRKLFEALPHKEQLQCVQEEAMTLTLERYMLPERETDTQKAYMRSLDKICTTTTKGWFRDFAVNNYMAVKDCPKDLRAIALKVINEYNEREKAKKCAEFEEKIGDDEMAEWFNDDEKKIVNEIVLPEDFKVQLCGSYYGRGYYESSEDTDKETSTITIFDNEYDLAVWEQNINDSGDCSSSYGGSINIEISQNGKRAFYYTITATHTTGNYTSNSKMSEYRTEKNEYSYSDVFKKVNGDILLRMIIMKYGLSFHNTDANMAIENRIKKSSSNINNYFGAQGIPLKYRDNKIYRASLVMKSW